MAIVDGPLRPRSLPVLFGGVESEEGGGMEGEEEGGRDVEDEDDLKYKRKGGEEEEDECEEELSCLSNEGNFGGDVYGRSGDGAVDGFVGEGSRRREIFIEFCSMGDIEWGNVGVDANVDDSVLQLVSPANIVL